MEYLLNRHVHYCETAEGIILLDLNSGKYLGVGPTKSVVLRAHLRGRQSPGKEATEQIALHAQNGTAFIQVLLKMGILTASENKGRLAFPPTIEIATSLNQWALPCAAISAMMAARLGITTSIVASLLHMGQLKLLIASLRRNARRNPDSGTHLPSRAIEVMSVFFKLRPWIYTAYGKCLLDSLVLSFFLEKAGVPSTFVIGVSTKPFEAHAWVQSAGVVLNETLETVSKFTPLLSI